MCPTSRTRRLVQSIPRSASRLPVAGAVDEAANNKPWPVTRQERRRRGERRLEAATNPRTQGCRRHTALVDIRARQDPRLSPVPIEWRLRPSVTHDLRLFFRPVSLVAVEIGGHFGPIFQEGTASLARGVCRRQPRSLLFYGRSHSRNREGLPCPLRSLARLRTGRTRGT